MTVAKRIAQFVVSTSPADLPPAAVTATRRNLLDTLAVTLAARSESAGQIAIAHVAAKGSNPTCTLVGSLVRACAEDAAWVNGILAHVLDFDDVGHHAQGHLSAVLFPPILALAEELGSTGAEVVTAYALGAEVWAKIARTMPMLHLKGWHPTAVFGTLGVSAAAAKLLRLDVAQTAHALGIAASTAAGLVKNFGTDTKSLHGGNAARNGIIAAQLARDGFTSAPDIFEAALGFPFAFFHGLPVTADEMCKELGQPWGIVNPGVNVKKYPCCLMQHRVVDAIIHLATQHDLRPDDIAEIRCEMPPLAPKILFYDEPVNGLEAKFSLHYCVASALMHRKLGLPQFSENQVHETTVRNLARKVQMHVHAGMDSNDNGDSYPDNVFVRCSDGREFAQSVLHAKGHAMAPLDWGELVDKFHDATAGVLTPAIASEVVDLVASIDALSNVRSLMRLTAAQPTVVESREIASFDPQLLDLSGAPDGLPHLLGSGCTECGTVYFPRQDLCSACMKQGTMEERFLSRRAKLYAFTVVERETLAPKGFEVPYAYGYVDLPEGVRVVAKIVDWSPETLQMDASLEMVVRPIRREPSGREVVGFYFRPVVDDPASQQGDTA